MVDILWDWTWNYILPERSNINSSLQFTRPLGNSPLCPSLARSKPRTLNEFQQVTPTYPQKEPFLLKVQEDFMLLRGSSKESVIDFKQEISLRVPELRLNVPGNNGQTRMWSKTRALALRSIWVWDFRSTSIDTNKMTGIRWNNKRRLDCKIFCLCRSIKPHKKNNSFGWYSRNESLVNILVLKRSRTKCEPLILRYKRKSVIPCIFKEGQATYIR